MQEAQQEIKPEETQVESTEGKTIETPEIKEKKPPRKVGDKKPPKKPVRTTKKEEPPQFNLKLFGRWDCSAIEIKDKSIKPYINLTPILIPKSYGRHYGHQFHKSKMHIVERLANHINVPGHKGKFHQITSGHRPGKFESAMNIVIKAFEIIEDRTKQNPVEVLVRALENSALREEVTAYQIGGSIVRKAVITSPQRRVDQALRAISQSSFRKSHKSKRTAQQALAEEIIAASKNDAQNSFAVAERERLEREATGSR